MITHEKPVGILNPQTATQKFRLTRELPAPDLAAFIEHYWIVQWDLPAPYTQENLPHPSVHLVFERHNTQLFGVMTGKFTRLIEGKGQVFGIKFRPGAFYPFVQTPMSRFTDATLAFRDVFGEDCAALESAILSLDDTAAMTAIAEDFLLTRLPAPDPNVELINQVIDCISTDRAIARVDDVVHRLNLNKRTLQRLFNQYVGVSPKWVIRRYRLLDAADQLANGTEGDCSKLAQELGYFDQAHFIKDFKAIVGHTPARYAKSAGQGL